MTPVYVAGFERRRGAYRRLVDDNGPGMLAQEDFVDQRAFAGARYTGDERQHAFRDVYADVLQVVGAWRAVIGSLPVAVPHALFERQRALQEAARQRVGVQQVSESAFEDDLAAARCPRGARRRRRDRRP